MIKDLVAKRRKLTAQKRFPQKLMMQRRRRLFQTKLSGLVILCFPRAGNRHQQILARL